MGVEFTQSGNDIVTRENNLANWAICEGDGSVADRFFSREEAENALVKDGYPNGCYVAEVADPGEL